MPIECGLHLLCTRRLLENTRLYRQHLLDDQTLSSLGGMFVDIAKTPEDLIHVTL